MKNDGLEDNYLALYVAIKTGCESSVALRSIGFSNIGGRRYQERKKPLKYHMTDDQIREMIRLHEIECMSLNNVAKVFGVSRYVIISRIRDYKWRNTNEGMEYQAQKF